tara:strand:+ start:1056 stop:2609 length:1554 start_codon:yes stop_codon:yes gene_type:complete
MYCGLSEKGRCKQVFSKAEVSDQCEMSDNKTQKRCKRKSMKNNPKKNTKKKCPKGKILNPKTNRCIINRKNIRKNTRKKCPKGKILNKKTNRCIIDRKKPEKKKICPPNKILNPKTNRCILNRKLDEEKVIKFNYRCKPGYIYNNATGRCVKKDGPEGKKILISSVTKSIGGPISFHYFKFEFGGVLRHFVLFGDQHTQYLYRKDPEIIEISTLIKKLVRKSPHCIDLFSENAIFHDVDKGKGKALQKYVSPLDAIRLEFGNCPKHNFNPGKCEYNNLRYQNWDLRFNTQEGPHWKYNPYDELFMKNRQEYIKILKQFSKRNIILYLLGFTERMKPAMVKKIDKYFDEAFSRVSSDSFKSNTSDKTMLVKRRRLIRKEYDKCMRSVDFPHDLVDTYIKSYNSLKDIDFTLVFTDFYMICRMFMNFDRNKKTPKGCPTKGNNNYVTPRYSIVYAGDQHIVDLFVFFEKMFKEKPFYTTKYNYPRGNPNKLIRINDIRDKNREIVKLECVDDLFKDFYE